MHVTHVTIKNIRRFKSISLDLTTNDGAKRWAMFTGDNGAGKTTFLRAIAMGLSDKDSAAGLLREIYGGWIRRNEKKASITISLIDRNKKKYSIKTNFDIGPSGRERISSQRTSPPLNEFPWNKLFVCGYGANRRIEGNLDYDEYSYIDSVYSLFNYEASLQSPEIVLRRRVMSAKRDASKRVEKEICNWIDNIFMLPSGSTKLTSKGFTIKGDWGTSPLGSLGDGYEATLTWILDMLGWAFLMKQASRGSKIRAIVFLDEIEQHLHPKWQIEIVKRLHETFPEIQFITTTHSPLCASSITDIPNDMAKLGLLEKNGDTVTLKEDLPELAGLRTDQVLASRVFGYLVNTNNIIDEKYRELSLLAGRKDLTVHEKIKYKKLTQELSKVDLFSGQTEIERKMQMAQLKRNSELIVELEGKLFENSK